MKKVSVIGLGYIGLPTAIICAQSGYDVLGFDIDKEKIKKINSSDPTIIEPEISERLDFVLKKKKFKAFDTLQKADVFVVSVPTPFKKNSNWGFEEADLSYVFGAAKKVSKVLERGNLVILESTIPVGTTFEFTKILERESGLKVTKDFFVSHCPERVLPGKIFKELKENDRVVGGICKKSASLSKEFYSKFVNGKIYLTDDKSAEMVKLVENSSRDVQIAFANQVASMCKKVKINPYSVIEFANMHPRVNILNPGCGVGGHCIAVDPWFLVEKFPLESQLLRTARNINDKRPDEVVSDVIKKVDSLKKGNINSPKILILGLTFKPDVDDLRGSPALKIATKLNDLKSILDLKVFDSNLSFNLLKKLNFSFLNNLESSIKWADMVVILVKHKEFFSINLNDFKNKIIIDETGLLYTLGEGRSQIFPACYSKKIKSDCFNV